MTERRKFDRYRIMVDTTVTLKGKQINCVAYDVSQGGISFVSVTPLQTGVACEIYIGQNQFLRKGRLVSAAPIQGKTEVMKYGIQFDQPMSEQQIGQFRKELK